MHRHELKTDVPANKSTAPFYGTTAGQGRDRNRKRVRNLQQQWNELKTNISLFLYIKDFHGSTINIYISETENAENFYFPQI